MWLGSAKYIVNAFDTRPDVSSVNSLLACPLDSYGPRCRITCDAHRRRILVVGSDWSDATMDFSPAKIGFSADFTAAKC